MFLNQIMEHFAYVEKYGSVFSVEEIAQIEQIGHSERRRDAQDDWVK